MEIVVRGDLVTVSLQGDFGKPRPALVIQSDHFSDLATLSILPLTSTLVDAPLLRVTLEPDNENCLERTSQVMVDKIMTVRRERIGAAFGRVAGSFLLEVDRTLVVFLGMAK